MPLTRDELWDLSMKAIVSAHNGDAEAAADALTRIGNDGGPQETYGACCAFAEVARQALTKLFDSQTPNLAAGDMWVLQNHAPDEPADPPQLFTMRFITAYCNQDHDQTTALFDATLSASIEEHMDSVITLLTTAVSMNQSARKQSDVEHP